MKEQRSPSLVRLHGRFEAIRPRIERHARISFRGIRCQPTRDDRIQETVAVTWKWFVDLTEKGRDATCFPMALATYAVRYVRGGRRLCGAEKARDVLSPVAQQRHGFAVERLPASVAAVHERRHARPRGQQEQDAFEERLQDNTVTPVPDQVAFRLDFPSWLRTLTARERRLIRRMMRNERTRDLAREFQVSEGRISQLRRQFQSGWTGFCADRLPD
jgi:hypothetical protein